MPIIYTASGGGLTYYATHPFNLEKKEEAAFPILCDGSSGRAIFLFLSVFGTQDPESVGVKFFASLEEGLQYLLDHHEGAPAFR